MRTLFLNLDFFAALRAFVRLIFGSRRTVGDRLPDSEKGSSNADEGSRETIDQSMLIENFGSTILSEVRIAILADDLRFVWVNEKFCKHFRYSPDELINRKLQELPCINHEKFPFEKVRKIISAGHSWSGEINVKKEDGESLWIKTTIIPVRRRSNSLASYVVFNSDITPTKNAVSERDQALEQLTLSETRYRALLEHQPDMVCLCKRDGTISYANSNFCNYARKLLHELYGINIRRFLFSGMSEGQVGMFFSLTPRFPEFSGVFELSDDAKNKFWCSLSAKGLFDSDGQLMEVLLVGRDVSHIKHAELKRQLYARDLERIAFITSHKVRGPIATMLGLVQLLDMNVISSDEWHTMLQSFRSCIGELDACTKELSGFIANRQNEE
jgi:PAS domain S-box-containing protein